ncbi:MAG: GAF domain-containing protein [Desulfobacteraceae bacterium]|nr:MAG: GAF domain-containing protein [Desulfobacteraceae bacterium]
MSSQDQKIGLGIYRLIVETVFDATNPSILGSQVTHLLVKTMDIKGATVFVVNPEEEELEILATEGLSIGYMNKGPILVDKSIKLASNLKPVIVADTQNSDQLQYPEKAQSEGIRSIVSLPVNLRGKIIGALRLYHSEPWEVADEELIYLTLLTKDIAMALRYFRLSSAVQCTRDVLEDVHAIWL